MSVSRLALLLTFLSLSVFATPFSWDKGYTTLSPPGDWSAFDYLSLDLENRSEKPFDLFVEVRDADSRDYWSRANIRFTLSKGRQKVNIPTRVFAGETLRPGRRLDSSRIVSVILARGDAQEGKLVVVHGFELMKGIKISERGIRAYDFGPVGSAVMPGFTEVTTDTLYDSKKGMGWVAPLFWFPYAQSCRVSGPDSLGEDCLMPYSGTFRVDLPPGNYEIAFAIDHPGPFWGEVPTWERRRVLANKKVLVDERNEAAQALARYFKNEKTLPGNAADVAKSFGPSRMELKTFEVELKNGPLNLSFENQRCPDRPCFGLALSTLIVAPKGALSGFLKELRTFRDEEFGQRFRWSSEVLATKVSKASQLVAAHKEFDHVVMEFKAESDLEDLSLEIESPDRALENSLQVGWVELRLHRLDPQGASVGLKDAFVNFDTPKISLKKGETRRFVVVFRPQSSKVPLAHDARIVVKGASRIVSTFPLSVKQRKRPLDEAPFAIGPFGDSVLERWWPDSESTPRANKLRELSLETMRGAGLNAFSFEAHIVGKQTYSFARINEVMEEAKAKGFRELVAYGHLFRDFDACRSDMRAAAWKKFFDAIEKESVARKWLPLSIVVCDEPEGDEIARVAALLSQLPKLSADARVKWTLTTHIESGTSLGHLALARKAPLPFIADFDLGKLSGPWVFYNNLSRWNFGFRAWALHKAHRLSGRIAWTWNQNAGDPFNPLDGREDDYRWCTSLKSGKLLCTIEFYDQVAAGVRDVRRMTTLENVAKNSPSNMLREEVRKLSDELVVHAGSKEASPEKIEAWKARAEKLLSEAGF